MLNAKTKKTSLESIIYGYTDENLRPKKLNIKSDSYGRIYLPKIGWFITNQKNELYQLSKNQENNYILLKDNFSIGYSFEPIEIIEDTNIELLKYPIPSLEGFYYDVDGNFIDVEIEEISKLHIHNILPCKRNFVRLGTEPTNKLVVDQPPVVPFQIVGNKCCLLL